ncbi:MAG: hypothetical protein R3304_00080 [Longimicrobiales bacterium]|nr:hypothetical protein [Longimicrobiales bacterium]
MMHSTRDRLRTCLVGGISALLLTLSVAVPVLEQDPQLFESVAENEHAPGECPSGHDHTVCTQVAKNLPIDEDVADTPATGALATVSTRDRAEAVAHRSDRGSPRSRAPPLV